MACCESDMVHVEQSQEGAIPRANLAGPNAEIVVF
jgi:hypothetical protein